MRYYYVQLDNESIVKNALDTFALINQSNMIQTDRFRSDLLDWKYENGQFYPPPPPPEA